jgi:hypothetical protein
MSRGGDVQTRKWVSDDLEPYRRLVELQKQMIELAQHHKQSRRACEALRAQIERETSVRFRGNSTLKQRLRAAIFRLGWFSRKESSPC